MCLVLKLEIGGGDWKTLLLREEFRCSLITYSVKIRKRERESKCTGKRARQTHWLYGNLLVFVRGRRERRFPLERAPASGEGPRNRLWTLSAGQHSRSLLRDSAPPSDRALKAGDRPGGDQAHTAWGSTKFTVYLGGRLKIKLKTWHTLLLIMPTTL